MAAYDARSRLRAPASGSRGRRPGRAAPPSPPACAVPAGFSGPVVRLNAELLGGMIGRTRMHGRRCSRLRRGALIVRDQSGFAGMLGLKSGDRVERANGVPLVMPADIAATVLQPLTRSQAVWVSGTRDGKAAAMAISQRRSLPRVARCWRGSSRIHRGLRRRFRQPVEELHQ